MEWVNFGIGENEATTTPGLVKAVTQMLTQPTGILGLTIYISVVSLVWCLLHVDIRKKG